MIIALVVYEIGLNNFKEGYNSTSSSNTEFKSKVTRGWLLWWAIAPALAVFSVFLLLVCDFLESRRLWCFFPVLAIIFALLLGVVVVQLGELWKLTNGGKTYCGEVPQTLGCRLLRTGYNMTFFSLIALIVLTVVAILLAYNQSCAPKDRRKKKGDYIPLNPEEEHRLRTDEEEESDEELEVKPHHTTESAHQL